MNEELIRMANNSISTEDIKFVFVVALLVVAVAFKSVHLFKLIKKDMTYER